MNRRIAGAAAAGAILAAVAATVLLLQPQPTRTIDIAIEHSRFHPAEVTVTAGETVRFVVRNGDPIAHEFILGSAAEQRAHERGRPREHHEPGAVSLEGGAEGVTEYTFDQAGTVIYGCHLPRHYDYGMRGTVVVEPA